MLRHFGGKRRKGEWWAREEGFLHLSCLHALLLELLPANFEFAWFFLSFCKVILQRYLFKSRACVSCEIRDMDLVVGDFVFIDPVPPAQEVRRGIVRFTGTTEFAEGPWVGVELVGSPGKNCGAVFGVQYFECLPLQGLFVRPELVRPYAPAPPSCNAEEKSAFDIDLRVELEELRDQVEQLSRGLEVKSLEVEELKLDKEIAEEQRIAAETELEELRLRGDGVGSSSSFATGGGSLAEVVVALKHDNAKLQRTVAALEEQRIELQEEVKAANASDSVVESLTTRNMELDEQLCDTRAILEKIIKERDGVQEILSMQDEELRHQRNDCEEAQSELEKLRTATEAQLHEMQDQLNAERTTVATLEHQLFELNQQLNVKASALHRSNAMTEVAGCVASVVVRCNRESVSDETPTSGSFFVACEWLANPPPSTLLSATSVLLLAQYELGQSMKAALNALERMREFLARLIEGLVGDKKLHHLLIGNSADAATSGTSVSPIVLHCVVVVDVLLAVEFVHLDLLELCCRFSDASATATLPIFTDENEAPGRFSMCSKICRLVENVRRIVSSFELPGVDIASLRETVRSLGVETRSLRVSLSSTVLREPVHAVPCGTSIELLSRLARIARGSRSVSEVPGSSVANVLCGIAALENDVLVARSDGQQSSSHIVMIPVRFLTKLITLWVGAAAAFVSILSAGQTLEESQSLFHQAMPSVMSTASSSPFCSLNLLMGGAGESTIIFASAEEALGGNEAIMQMRHSCCAVLGDGHSKTSEEHAPRPLSVEKPCEALDAMWTKIRDLTIQCANESFTHCNAVVKLLISNLVVSMLRSTCTHETNVAVAEAPPTAHLLEEGEMRNAALQQQIFQLENEVEETKRLLWDATSENQALTLIKADFKRIQGQLETQEAAHQLSLRSVSQEYDAGIAVLLQKNAKITAELRDAQRHNLQQVVSPMSLWERIQYQDALFNTQLHLSLASGLVLRSYSFVNQWKPKRSAVVAPRTCELSAPTAASPPLSRVHRFTTKANRLAAREAVLVPKVFRASS